MRELVDIVKAYLAVFFAIAIAIGATACVSIAFAQASLPASLPADVDVGEAVAELLKSIGGLKGASALGIALVCVQGVMLFFRTSLANFAGKYRLLVVAGLSLVFGVLALRVSGVDWVGSFVHANTLAAVQVFGSQVLIQVKKES